MGTTAHVIVVGGPPELGAKAETRLHELENRWSRFKQQSELSELNRRPGKRTMVSSETYRLVATAIDAWRLTDGRFDPTLAETMDHAGYDRSFELLDRTVAVGSGTNKPAPTPADIELDSYSRSIVLPPGVRLDLGGIAKGAAADLVVEELLAAGAAGCCVNVGGDLRVEGEAPRSEGWMVSLGGPQQAATLTANLSRGAVCTSTTTKRRWVGHGGPENHLRDPVTGASVISGLETVSVISATAIQAEVLTKAAFVAGRETAETLVLAAGATGLFVEADGRSTYLPGLDRFLVANAPVAKVG